MKGLLVLPCPPSKNCIHPVRKRAQKITLDPHIHHPLFELLPSSRLYRAPNTRTARHKNSFFPRQSTFWTVKCAPHYALKMCNNLLCICYHLHPSAHLCISSILFHYLIYSTTVHTMYLFLIFVYLYLHMCIFYFHLIFIVCVFLSLCTGSLCH